MAVPASVATILDGVMEQIRLLVVAVRDTHLVGPQAQEGTTVNDALSAVDAAGENWFKLSDAIEAEIDSLEEQSTDDVIPELQACRSALMLLNLEVAKECDRAGSLEGIATLTENGESTFMAEIIQWNEPPPDEYYESSLWEVVTGRPNLVELLYVGTDDVEGGAPEPIPFDDVPPPESGLGRGLEVDSSQAPTLMPGAAFAGGGEPVDA